MGALAYCDPDSEGGWRQQQERLLPALVFRISLLAAGLLLEWCDGDSSSTRLRFHNANAMGDGMRHPMIVRLGSVPGGQNAHRGIMEILENLGIADLLTQIPGPPVTWLLLPSSLAGVLCNHYPREFRVRLGADTGRLRDFWTTFLARPATKAWADRHPYLAGKSAGDLVTSIPCTLHIDAGPYSKRLSCICISWSSLLSDGSEKVTKYLISSYLKADGSSHHAV